jgi:hypothetical protein
LKTLIINFAPAWIIGVILRLRGLAKGKWPLALAKRNLAQAASTQTLSGKILLKMAFDRDPILTIFADKFKVREYVADRVGSRYLSKLIAHGDSAEALKDLAFPKNFALKSNHGSGGMILVWENAPEENRLPKKLKTIWNKHLIQPRHFDFEIARKLSNRWLSNNFYFRPGQFPEWGYKDIVPQLIVEELMLDDHGNLPSDYKFFMVDGQCVFIQVDSSRFDGHTRDLFTSSWSKIQGSYQHPESGRNIEKPKYLSEMLDVAKKLASGVDFVRVDLYETAQGVRFGELTNYPGGGIEVFSPGSLDSKLGASWNPSYRAH